MDGRQHLLLPAFYFTSDGTLTLDMPVLVKYFSFRLLSKRYPVSIGRTQPEFAHSPRLRG